jgi:hypothetical protein
LVFLNIKTIAKIPEIMPVTLSFPTNVKVSDVKILPQCSEKSFCVVRSSIFKK